MPQDVSRTLDAVLERETPEAVYLLHGDDDFLKDETGRALVERFVDPASQAFNVDIMHGADVSAGQLATALDALPIMAARRIVVLRDFPALRKDCRAVLDAYLQRPAADTLVILSAPAGWKPDAAIMSRAVGVEFTIPEDDEAVTWIVARARSLGMSIDLKASQLLLRATGVDLALLDGELRKLRDFTTDGVITTDAIGAVVGVTAGETADDLLDLVCARDGPGAARIVGTVLGQPKTSGVSLVLAMTAHVLLIGHGLTSRDRRASPRQITLDLYGLMGEARSVAVGRPWGAAVAAVTRHANEWNHDLVERALHLLRDADSTLKDANLSSEERILETLVLTICARSQRSRAA